MKAYVCGTSGYEGLYSNLRGEGRWALSVAKYLRLLGYEVTIYGQIPQDGYEKKHDSGYIWSIKDPKELMEQYGPFDVGFFTQPTWIENKADWAYYDKYIDKRVMGTFWPQSPNPLPAKSRYICPHRSVNGISLVPADASDESIGSNFNNKGIIFTCRGALSGKQRDQTNYIVNVHQFQIALEALDKGYKVTVGCYDPHYLVRGKIESTWFDEASRCIEVIRNHPNGKVLENMAYDKFVDEIRRHSIAMPCDITGAMFTTITYGLVPILLWDYSGYVFPHECLKRLGTIPGYYYNTPKENIRDRIFRLLEDEAFHKEQLSICREYMPSFTFKEGSEMLGKVIASI